MELLNLKAKMQLSAVELTYKLNEVDRKKKFQLLESFCELMLRNLGFYEKVFQLFKEVEPVLKEMYQALLQVQ
jgi:hypothetical protein